MFNDKISFKEATHFLLGSTIYKFGWVDEMGGIYFIRNNKEISVSMELLNYLREQWNRNPDITDFYWEFLRLENNNDKI